MSNSDILMVLSRTSLLDKALRTSGWDTIKNWPTRETSLITHPELSHNISLNSYMISKEGHCWKRTTKFKYKINNLNFYCNNTIPCGHYLHRIHWYFKNLTNVIFLCADKKCHKIALLKRTFKIFNFLSFVYKS